MSLLVCVDKVWMLFFCNCFVMHMLVLLWPAVARCSCNHQVRLKSLHSKAPSVIVFTNKTTFPVRALWLDFEGNEVVYSVLEPNSTKRYHTYVTHPWIVREVQSSTRMMLSGRPAVVGLSTEQTVEIQAPKQLPWTVSGGVVVYSGFKCGVLAEQLLAGLCLQGIQLWYSSLQESCLQESCDVLAAVLADSCCLQDHFALRIQLLFLQHSVACCCCLHLQLDNHSCFPEQYKSEVKALLLSHKKLELAANGPFPSAFPSASSARAGAASPLPPVVPASPARAGTPFSTCSMDVCTGTPMSPGHTMRCTTPLSPRASFSSAISSSSGFAPRSSPMGMLAVPEAAAPSAATSISFSSDATQFTATVTVTSPRRAVLSSRMNMNIEVTTGSLGSTTNINFNTMLDGGDTGAAVASTVSGCMSPVARRSEKKGIFK
jgi:hypothetical protein